MGLYKLWVHFLLQNWSQFCYKGPALFHATICANMHAWFFVKQCIKSQLSKLFPYGLEFWPLLGDFWAFSRSFCAYWSSTSLKLLHAMPCNHCMSFDLSLRFWLQKRITSIILVISLSHFSKHFTMSLLAIARYWQQVKECRIFSWHTHGWLRKFQFYRHAWVLVLVHRRLRRPS